jgi:hypothetical protein
VEGVKTINPDLSSVWSKCRKRPLERPRRRRENGIKIDLREIGWGGVEWIHLAQDRDRWRAVVNTVMNLRILAAHSGANVLGFTN